MATGVKPPAGPVGPARLARPVPTIEYACARAVGEEEQAARRAGRPAERPAAEEDRRAPAAEAAAPRVRAVAVKAVEVAAAVVGEVEVATDADVTQYLWIYPNMEPRCWRIFCTTSGAA